MPDGEQNTDGAEAPEEKVIPATEAQAAFKARDKAKEELRAAQARLAEYEAKEREAKEKAAQEANDFATLKEMMAQEKADLAAQLEAAQGEIAKRDRAVQANRFVEQVMAQSGLTADLRHRVEALLLLEEREGMDIAPAENAELHAKNALARLKKRDPLTFQPKDMGPKGAPGLSAGETPAIDDDMVARVKATAAAMSGWKPPS